MLKVLRRCKDSISESTVFIFNSVIKLALSFFNGFWGMLTWPFRPKIKEYSNKDDATIVDEEVSRLLTTGEVSAAVTPRQLDNYLRSKLFNFQALSRRQKISSTLAVSFARQEEFEYVRVCLERVKSLIEEDSRLEVIYRILTSDKPISSFYGFAKLAIHKSSDTDRAEYDIDKKITLFESSESGYLEFKKHSLIAYIVKKHPELLELFIENGAAYDSLDLYKGLNLYALAAMSNCVTILEYFREKGTEHMFINRPTHGGYSSDVVSSVGLNQEHEQLGDEYSPLISAIRYGATDAAFFILSYLKMTPQKVFETTDSLNRNALHWSVIMNNLQITRHLLSIARAGFNDKKWIFKCYDVFGKSPLTLAHESSLIRKDSHVAEQIYDMLSDAGFTISGKGQQQIDLSQLNTLEKIVVSPKKGGGAKRKGLSPRRLSVVRSQLNQSSGQSSETEKEESCFAYKDLPPAAVHGSFVTQSPRESSGYDTEKSQLSTNRMTIPSLPEVTSSPWRPGARKGGRLGRDCQQRRARQVGLTQVSREQYSDHHTDKTTTFFSRLGSGLINRSSPNRQGHCMKLSEVINK